MTSSAAVGVVPEITPVFSMPSAAGPETGSTGAAITPEANNANSGLGDCCPKCAVLGRENIESPEPELAMAIDPSIALRLITCFQDLRATIR